jgi:hypothetical protein
VEVPPSLSLTVIKIVSISSLTDHSSNLHRPTASSIHCHAHWHPIPPRRCFHRCRLLHLETRLRLPSM